MTRKRALALARAAVVRDCPDGALPSYWPAVERGLDLAVEAGVVIGMLRAAGRCSKYPSANSVRLLRKEIRADANRLARKLRGAR